MSRLATEYTHERVKSFTGSEFDDFVRHDIAVEAKKVLLLWPFELKVKASVGQGVWASVPWLAFFDPLITETATKGFYVVYLINPDAQKITLSMNQGTTAIYNDFGQSRGRDVLRCSIPDDHIDPRRSALFMARSLLREVRDGGRRC
nr:DUF3578 domain-containing protein [Rhodovulum sulfidophilum]